MHNFASHTSYYILYLQNFKAKIIVLAETEKNINYNPLNYKS